MSRLAASNIIWMFGKNLCRHRTYAQKCSSVTEPDVMRRFHGQVDNLVDRFVSFVTTTITSKPPSWIKTTFLAAACPSGTYKNHTGSGDVSVCSRCPNENQETAPGATLVHECRCKRGFRNFNSTECTGTRQHWPATLSLGQNNKTNIKKDINGSLPWPFAIV